MLCLINKLIGLLVWMCVVSLPLCPQGLSERAQFTSRSWKIAHTFSWAHISYTQYKDTHISFHAHKQIYFQAALADPVSVSFNSVFPHSLELPGLDWLRFQGVLWANGNHTEGNRIVFFAYCPSSNPRAGTQGWSHITAQSKNVE